MEQMMLIWSMQHMLESVLKVLKDNKLPEQVIMLLGNLKYLEICCSSMEGSLTEEIPG